MVCSEFFVIVKESSVALHIKLAGLCPRALFSKQDLDFSITVSCCHDASLTLSFLYVRGLLKENGIAE